MPIRRLEAKMPLSIRFRFSVGAVFLIFFICQNMAMASGQTLRPVDFSDLPLLQDDFDPSSLLQAANRQRVSLQNLPPKTRISFGQGSYSPNQLIASINEFIQIIEKTETGHDTVKALEEKFSAYQAAGGKSADAYGKMLVTGYFEPTFEGSLQRQPPFLFPLYLQPSDLKSEKSADSGKVITGRISKGKLIPYWTRAEIETRDILSGSELVFLKDPFEVFLLHVQGSGKIKLRDGTLRAVGYAASNGHPYRSIGKLLIDEKRMSAVEANLPAIEGYLKDNPEDLTRVLHSNPRFIFFRWRNSHGPRGNSNIQLTAGRSIAIDHQALPSGTIGFLCSRMPVFDRKGTLTGWTPIHRFVFPQDAGAAIQGAGRVDLFLGDSEYARRSAGLMKEEGNLYFFVKK